MNPPRSLPARPVTAIKKNCQKIASLRLGGEIRQRSKADKFKPPAMRVVVDGQTYHQDLIIIRGQVRANWWRKQGHRLDPDDIKDVVHARPQILVVGTGYAGNMHVPDITRNALSKHHINIISEITSEATKIYNQLVSEGKDVAGAFHLTC